MRFVEDIYAPFDSIAAEVPLIEYQEYAFRRFKLDRQFNTNVDIDRFNALTWYIEGYSVLRKPLQTPFSAAQVRWLLNSSSGYMSERSLPRIVELFWRRSLIKSLNPYESADAYAKLAYWWSAEMVMTLGLKTMVPEAFVIALRAPAAGQTHAVPLCEFMQQHLSHSEGVPWVASSEAERLACYIKVLSEPEGLHYSLFFPDAVMNLLTQLEAPEGDVSGLFHLDLKTMIPRVRRRAEKAMAHRAQHRKIRSGNMDISAAKLEAGWEALESTPAPRGKVAPKVYPAPATSILPFPVRVIGPINSQSGLGQATRMSIDALHRVGIRPELLDFYLDNPAPRRMFWPDTPITDDSPFAINILHLNAESVPLAAAYLKPHLFKNAYNLGYVFWELPQPARCHELAMKTLDEIWTSSEFNRDTYSAVTAKPVTKVGMAVEALPELGRADRAAVRRRYGLSPTATVFMATFDGFSFIKRKNPTASLRAFLSAFGDKGEDVAMVLKTHNLSKVLGETNVQALINEIVTLAESDPRIIIIDETLPFNELLELKSAADCYVSLHRSEGWGFGLIEAMQLGLPVIATSFSGNLEFCTPETSLNVDFHRSYLEQNDYIFVRPGDYWAEPDVPMAARFMRQVHEDPEAAKALGLRARAFVEAQFSLEAVGQRYLARLNAIAVTR